MTTPSIALMSLIRTSTLKLQGALLKELLDQMNENCQLWISTHSIGMMRYARSLQEADPDDVAFIDFQGHDFDQATSLEPVQADRRFWSATLEVALGDLADLVAPSRVILCEGDPASNNPAKQSLTHGATARSSEVRCQTPSFRLSEVALRSSTITTAWVVQSPPSCRARTLSGWLIGIIGALRRLQRHARLASTYLVVAI